MTIEERLENMERELGRLKRRARWLLGVMLLMVGVFAIGFFETTASKLRAQGAGREKEVRANKLTLEDERGEVRASLGIFLDKPALTLFDKNGEVRAGLGVFKDGPSLDLYDENGKYRAGLSIVNNEPGLTLHDENGNARAMLTAHKEALGLTLFDENGEPRFVAGKPKTVTPGGKTIAYPESSLILFGPDGKVIWSAIK